MAVNVGNLEATLGMDTKGFKDGAEAEKIQRELASRVLKSFLAVGGGALVGLGGISFCMDRD